MMQINYHGGQCCGIKTITHMAGPDYPEPAIDAIDFKESVHSKDKRGAQVSSEQNLYYGPALPQQSGKDRLIAYLDFLRKKRPSGAVEITLAKGSYVNQTSWFPVLKELGFKRTACFRNSNSGNQVSIFLLVMLEGETQLNLVSTTGPAYDEDAVDYDDDEEDYDPDYSGED